LLVSLTILEQIVKGVVQRTPAKAFKIGEQCFTVFYLTDSLTVTDSSQTFANIHLTAEVCKKIPPLHDVVFVSKSSFI